MEREIFITGKMNRQYFPLNMIARNVSVEFSIGTRTDTSKKEELPKNVCFVVDESGSMDGDRIRLAKDAMKSIVWSFKRGDHLTVVGFGSDVRIRVPCQEVIDAEKICKDIENNVQIEGSTNLYGGVEKGFKELSDLIATLRGSERPHKKIFKMFILSDGHANVGPSTPKKFGKLAKDIREMGIICTTIGIGEGYEEEILTAISNNSSGEWHHIENEEDIKRVIQSEIRELKTVRWTAPKLKITPTKGVTLHDFIQYSPHLQEITNIKEEKGAFVLPIGDIKEGEDQTYKAKVDLHPKTTEGWYDIITFEIEGEPTSRQTLRGKWTTNEVDYRVESDSSVRLCETVARLGITLLKDPNNSKAKKQLSQLCLKEGSEESIVRETILKGVESGGSIKIIKKMIRESTKIKRGST